MCFVSSKPNEGLVSLISHNMQDTEDTGKLPPIIVVGNKSDLENERVISREEGEAMAKEYGGDVLFIEASAKGNINVTKVKCKNPQRSFHFHFRFSRK